MWSSVQTISCLVILVLVAFFSDGVAVVFVTSYQFANIPTTSKSISTTTPSSSSLANKKRNEAPWTTTMKSSRRGRPDLLRIRNNRGSAVTITTATTSIRTGNAFRLGISSSSSSSSSSSPSSSVRRSVSFGRPVWMVPRGGDSETESGNVNSNVDATTTTTATAEAAATASAEEHKERSPRSPGSILPRKFATMVVFPSSPLAVLRPVASLYCAALARHPIATNCVTAAVLSVTSDTLAQTLERRRRRISDKDNDKDPAAVATVTTPTPTRRHRHRHDFSRSAWMAVWGFVISGWMIHYWFLFLNGLFPVKGLTLVGALKKVTVNQLVMSPGLNSLFFAFATYTRGGNGNGNKAKAVLLKRKLAADLVPTMKRSCMYWGTIQMVNFLLVPPRFAILFTNVGFLLWTTYISLVGFRTVPSTD